MQVILSLVAELKETSCPASSPRVPQISGETLSGFKRMPRTLEVGNVIFVAKRRKKKILFIVF